MNRIDPKLRTVVAMLDYLPLHAVDAYLLAEASKDGKMELAKVEGIAERIEGECEGADAFTVALAALRFARQVLIETATSAHPILTN